jgi:uncharacterized BrkB/YihY/UPF0761 family membrane protein
MSFEVAGPTALFVLFALLSTIGVYLAARSQRGHRAGLVGAVLTLLFFAALGVGLVFLLREMPHR